MEEKELSIKPLISKKMDTFVGYCEVELNDDQMGVNFPMSIMYPTNSPGKVDNLGPFSLNISKDAPLKKGVYQLILISHGSGGSNLLYRTLAHYLACNGFIVGMPEHPFNNRNNNSLVNTVENLTIRPKHLGISIDCFFKNDKFKENLKPNSVSIIGHSMGGYTALTLAGGKPTSFPHESPSKQAQQIPVISDHRVTSLVLLAPATVWFKEEMALSAVNVPILLFTAEKDEYTPWFHSEIILKGVPDKAKIQHRIVENAGHFSFLSPFPESLNNPSFPPSQDPPGFNRQSFHHELNSEILEFLLREA